MSEQQERTHFEADRRVDGHWQPIQVEPFSGFYEFDVEQAAVDAARRNYGDEEGYRIRRVTTITEVVTEFVPRA